jgi:predicted DCC family thiol-disulfide oxidoreductase YuxK
MERLIKHLHKVLLFLIHHLPLRSMNIDELNSTDNVILFDGFCNLCSATVQFVIKRDKKNKFKFASLQSVFGQSILHRFHLSPHDLNSFILYKNGKIYLRSTGALLVAKELPGVWPLLSAFIIVPPLFRDAVYNFISKNRYRWFGKKNECWLPTPLLREKFIEQ